jgi:hypothetical protein
MKLYEAYVDNLRAYKEDSIEAGVNIRAILILILNTSTEVTVCNVGSVAQDNI